MAVVLDSANNLIALADLKTFMNVEASDTTFDDTYTLLINAVSKWFNNKTNRLLKARDNTEYYDGDGTTKLFTDNYPINSTSATIAVYIDQEWLWPDSDKVDQSDILIRSEEGVIIIKDQVFTEGTQNIKVVYNAGYSSIPFDLQEACLLMCKLLDKRKDQDGAGLSTISLSNNQATYMLDKVAPEFVLDVVKTYWRPARCISIR